MPNALFQPLKIREITFRNRIGVSPMCQYSCEDGFATDWHLVHLGSRAVGGAGLVMAEASAVEARGRISPEDLGIWKDEHIPNLKRVTSFVESQGAVPGIQLAHAGRKASTPRPWSGKKVLDEKSGGWDPIVAPSAIPFYEDSQVPEALTVDGIAQVVSAFAQAASRALAAGFKVVEIHAAHGYLIHQFLSPASNKRTDNYGGSFENRTRILRETVAAVRRVWPENLPLFVRISATDWLESGGWDLDQSVALAKVLRESGVDAIDCSSGALLPNVRMAIGPGYQVPFAERIKKESGILTAAVGLITSPAQAEEIVKSGKADIILLARQFLRDPYFPLHAAKELGADISWPVQYERAKP